MKKGFKENIEKLTTGNENFREVLYTSGNMQLVLMTLLPGEEIGLETHPENDQFFRFEEGEGEVFINDTSYKVSDGDAVIIPALSKHNVVNTSSDKKLKMYTIYAPAHHKDKIVRSTKKEAEENEEDFDGVTSE